MPGYSGTPLIKKLGIKEGFRVALINAPKGFEEEELGPLPTGSFTSNRAAAVNDLILVFVTTEKDLRTGFAQLAAKLEPAGMLWVAWPKKSSGVRTDLSFGVVQRIGLDAGLVDVKICAVTEIWSGLKFVIRVKDRPRK
jgi:hypothetical protein